MLPRRLVKLRESELTASWDNVRAGRCDCPNYSKWYVFAQQHVFSCRLNIPGWNSGTAFVERRAVACLLTSAPTEGFCLVWSGLLAEDHPRPAPTLTLFGTSVFCSTDSEVGKASKRGAASVWEMKISLKKLQQNLHQIPHSGTKYREKAHGSDISNSPRRECRWSMTLHGSWIAQVSDLDRLFSISLKVS